MKHFLLVTVFVVGLLLKISNATAAEVNAIVDSESEAEATTRTETITKPETHINNNITVTPSSPTAVKVEASPTQPQIAYHNGSDKEVADAALVLGTKQKEESKSKHVGIVPMLGVSAYTGGWYSHVSNAYSFGLALDIPMSDLVSFEVEGNYGRFNVSYAYYGHDFDRYSLGGNLKIFLIKSVVRPYIGAGLAAVDYQNMTHGPFYRVAYDRWIGVGQIMGGLDFALSDSIAIGGRASYALPMINRPAAAGNAYFSYPYYEEAALINTAYYRLMGSVSISL